MTRVMSGLSRIDKWPRLFIASIVAIGLGGVGLVGRQPAAPALTSIEVMIPMRDGTRLFTQIYTPVGVTDSRCRSSSSGRPTASAATRRRWWRRRWSICPRSATSS